MTQPPDGAHPGYGPPPSWQARPTHPDAVTVLVLGILGITFCFVTAPFAWVMGNRVVREIDLSRGEVDGRSMANAGRVCGMVGTALVLAAVALVLVLFVIGGVFSL